MSHSQFYHRLRVVADVDSTLLSRICGRLANFNLVPLSLSALLDVSTDQLTLEIVLIATTNRQADLLHRMIHQMTTVRSATVNRIEPSRDRDDRKSIATT